MRDAFSLKGWLFRAPWCYIFCFQNRTQMQTQEKVEFINKNEKRQTEHKSSKGTNNRLVQEHNQSDRGVKKVNKLTKY